MAKWLWAVAGSMLLGTGAAAATPIEANLEVVGRWSGEPLQSYGDVAVVGTTAILTTEAGVPCPASSATVIDVKNPRSPRFLSAISVPAGMTASEVDAASVSTPAFTGDLVAMVLMPSPGCGATGPVVALHDVTDPAQPRLLAQTAGSQSVSLAQRADGRVLAATMSSAPPGVVLDDVSDPAHPVTLAQWEDPQPAAIPACGAANVVLQDDGTGAVVTFADGRAYDLDLTEPRNPSAGEPAAGGGAGYAAVLPLGNRTIAIVSEYSCGAADAALGLRVLVLEREAGTREEAPVRFPGAAAPGRLVASGALAYVAWHGDGVRVIDFGEVRARTVAQFAPEQADVVGVALLPQHIVVTDRASGLYVLDRPEEAGGRAGFWGTFGSLLPYLGGAMVMAAAFVVPRLAMGRAPVGSGSPVPSPARRRRA